MTCFVVVWRVCVCVCVCVHANFWHVLLWCKVWVWCSWYRGMCYYGVTMRVRWYLRHVLFGVMCGCSVHDICDMCYCGVTCGWSVHDLCDMCYRGVTCGRCVHEILCDMRYYSMKRGCGVLVDVLGISHMFCLVWRVDVAFQVMVSQSKWWCRALLW